MKTYPPGSAREKMQRLNRQADEILVTVRECKDCNTKRADAAKLRNEAEKLWPQIYQEIEAEKHPIAPKRIIYDSKTPIETPVSQESQNAIKRKRGRPRKVRP